MDEATMMDPVKRQEWLNREAREQEARSRGPMGRGPELEDNRGWDRAAERRQEKRLWELISQKKSAFEAAEAEFKRQNMAERDLTPHDLSRREKIEQLYNQGSEARTNRLNAELAPLYEELNNTPE